MEGLIRIIARVRAKVRRFRNPPIFIVGCGHSGTSLALTVLGSHSRICAIPFESDFAGKGDSADPQRRKAIEAQLLSFDHRAVQEGKARWVEKTPRHIRHIPEILATVPNAKVILMIRDGRDVARSMQCRTGSLEDGVRKWKELNRMGQEHWEHPQVRPLRYESILDDFSGTITSLMGFLGERFEPGLTEFHATPRRYYSDVIEKPPDSSDVNHKQFRNWQINQPLFDGRGRWKEFSEAEKAYVKGEIGEMLIEYGYVSNHAW